MSRPLIDIALSTNEITASEFKDSLVCSSRPG